MKPLTLIVAAGMLAFSGSVLAAVTIGQSAPDFSLTDLNGKVVKLSDFKGKHVVLEWHNPNCPFVMKHYDSGNMPSLQAKVDAKDTVWLAINSTNPQHQDFMKPAQLKTYLAEKKATPDAYLDDSRGDIGRQYGAKTTPHMYIVNPAGTLVYAGAIDDKRSASKEDIKTAKNYVVAALEESKTGKAVSTASTTPYGCSVKYN